MQARIDSIILFDLRDTVRPLFDGTIALCAKRDS